MDSPVPLIDALGWIALVTLGVVFAVLKLVKWSLNAEAYDVRGRVVDDAGNVIDSPAHILVDLYKAFLLLVVVVLFWPGLASWASGAWTVIINLIP